MSVSRSRFAVPRRSGMPKACAIYLVVAPGTRLYAREDDAITALSPLQEIFTGEVSCTDGETYPVQTQGSHLPFGESRRFFPGGKRTATVKLADGIADSHRQTS